MPHLDIKKELITEKNKIITEAKKAKREVDKNVGPKVFLISEKSTSQEQKILETICGKSNYTHNFNKMSELIVREKHEKDYGGDIFSRKEINNLIVKYNLFFETSTQFNGELEYNMAREVRKFFENYSKSEISDQYFKYNFYILAPPSYFKNKQNINKIKTTCMLFYKIDDGYYKLIYKWGKNFSPLREFFAFEKRTFLNMLIFRFFCFLPLTTFAFTKPYNGAYLLNNSLILIPLMLIINTFLTLLIPMYNYWEIDRNDKLIIRKSKFLKK